MCLLWFGADREGESMKKKWLLFKVEFWWYYEKRAGNLWDSITSQGQTSSLLDPVPAYFYSNLPLVLGCSCTGVSFLPTCKVT
jgi:hypothetical protein